LLRYLQLKTNTRIAKAQLLIDVIMSVEVGNVLPVHGSHSGPESDATTMSKSSKQNLRFIGGFSAAGKSAAS
jgi:hypothetical protein